jgi:transcriptional regulator with XRE-family HTH domain
LSGADEDLPAEVSRPDSSIARIRLGAQLRRLRDAAGVTPEAAAWAIRASRSKISRLENGRIGFKERDVSDLLALYGVTDPQLVAGTMELTAKANAQAWWSKYSDVLPGWFEPYLGLEAAAQRIRTFDQQLVHGLFQTQDYAREITTVGLRQSTAREINRHVSVRMRRQELLTAPDAPQVWSILDEAALHRPVGGTAVMRAQLRHLTEVARLPNITLQVIPYSVGAHDGVGGSFALLRFTEPEIPDVVYIEQLTGAQYLDRRNYADQYLDILNRLSALALSPERTTAFLAGLIDEMQPE